MYLTISVVVSYLYARRQTLAATAPLTPDLASGWFRTNPTAPLSVNLTEMLSFTIKNSEKPTVSPTKSLGFKKTDQSEVEDYFNIG